MTLLALYQSARRQLGRAGIEDPGGEAALLLEHFCGCGRAALLTHGRDRPAPHIQAVQAAVAQRAARRPLQYILGSWPFMGLTLQVGEGVLIPREDTAVLAEAAASRLKGTPETAGALRGVELCAGTGAVSLALCDQCPGVEMFAVELSGEAYAYLLRNLAAYPDFPVTPLRGDVLDRAVPGTLPPVDFIVSNPPYISAPALPLLQAEVRREPRMALDGGPDGLLFYRAIADIWLPRLKPGGLIALEIGEDQGDAVAALLRKSGVQALETHRDLAGLNRAVIGFSRGKPAP